MPRVMPLIETNVLPDGAVYGVPQVSYTVGDVSGRDFTAALTVAAFKQTAAIESASTAYADLVRVRSQKIEDLGTVLAYLNKALTSLRPTNGQSGDTATIDNSAWVNATAKKYGITLVFKENTGDMTRENIMNGQNEIQYAIDTEDNNLQQDLVALQGLVSKRDSAQSTAARVVRKADEAAKTTIGNIQ